MIYMLIVKTVRIYIYIYDQIFGYVFKHKKISATKSKFYGRPF